MKLKEQIRQAVQQPSQQMFAALAGLISVLSIVMLISGFIVGQQFSNNVFGAKQLYLIAIFIHGASCVTLYQGRKFHKLEKYTEYRDWMVATGALAVCNLFILIQSFVVLRKVALMILGFTNETVLAIGSMFLLFYFVLGFISLLRAVQRSFITATYLDGFIEGLQIRFAKRQRRLWLFWVSSYVSIIAYYCICFWIM
jgi:hypothetical protein